MQLRAISKGLLDEGRAVAVGEEVEDLLAFEVDCGAVWDSRM